VGNRERSHRLLTADDAEVMMMARLRKAGIVLLGLMVITALNGCSRTKKDITVERHVIGEEFVVE